MKGWYNERYRHYLAAKGVSTNRYYRKKVAVIPETPFSSKWGVMETIRVIPINRIERLPEEINPTDEQKIVDIKHSGEIRRPIVVWAPQIRESEKPLLKKEYFESDDHPGPFASDPGKYQLSDGHHRFEAAKERGDINIVAKVQDKPLQTKAWRDKWLEKKEDEKKKYFAGFGRPASEIKVVNGKLVSKSGTSAAVSDASASKYAFSLIEAGDEAIVAGNKALAEQKYNEATEIRKALDVRRKTYMAKKMPDEKQVDSVFIESVRKLPGALAAEEFKFITDQANPDKEITVIRTMEGENIKLDKYGNVVEQYVRKGA